MSMLDELQEIGVDVNEGLQRFMNNTSLYEKMLRTFPNMIHSSKISPDFDDSECDDMIEKTHALKGVTGNLSLTPLFVSYTKIVDSLRRGEPEEARVELNQLLPVQEKIVNCIEKYSN